MPKSIKSNRKKVPGRLDWVRAPDVKRRIISLVSVCGIDWVKPSKIFSFRSTGAKTRAIARIWGLNRIWQIALKKEPNYIIEVISERFDALSDLEKDKVLLHEISHIPKNFSGALVPHVRRGKRSFYDKVHKLLASYLKNSK